MLESAGLDVDWRPGCSLAALRERAHLLARIRGYFERQGVMEVETPSLCQYVGTDPHLDYFSAGLEFDGTSSDRRLFLQTSPEYSMKRLLAAGSGSIFQICKAFRNGESGHYHNPEFSILEWYRVGYGLDQLIEDVERLLGRELGLLAAGQSADRMTYQNVFLHYCGIDPLTARIPDYRACAEKMGEPDGSNVCGNDVRLWQEYLFGLKIQPRLGSERLCFVVGYPAEQAALAKISESDPRIAERVEVFYRGVELANGFCELRVGSEQRARFERDLLLRKRLKKAQPAIDRRFLAALDSGIPACAGVAVGLDRVLMLLMNAASIDEVLSFSLSRA